MRLIFGIPVMFMFIGAALGSLFQDPVICRFSETDQCYVALGQSLQLPIPRVVIFNLDISSQKRSISKFRKAQSDTPKLFSPRWQFVNENNTAILNSTVRTDSGTYTLYTFDAKGTSTGKYTLEIHTEAEVSSVSVWYSCSPTEDIKVYCSADGDDLIYSWTSDFHTISQVENGTITQTLSKEYHGNVTCYVKNHVSQSQRSIVVQPCQEPTTTATTVNFSTNLSQQTGMISPDGSTANTTHNNPSESLQPTTTVNSGTFSTSFQKISKEGYTTNTTHNNPSESLHPTTTVTIVNFLTNFSQQTEHTIIFLGVLCAIIILVFIAELYMHRTKKSQKTEAAPPQYDEVEMKQEP